MKSKNRKLAWKVRRGIYNVMILALYELKVSNVQEQVESAPLYPGNEGYQNISK